MIIKIIIMMSASLQLLSACHPLIIEGPGRHDTRDPASVARQLCSRLRSHWKQHPPQREVVLVTQGDPIEETGIAAITRHVASELGISRCLVALDTSIDPTHKKLADMEAVSMELWYSQLAEIVSNGKGPGLEQLTSGIDEALAEKNRRAAENGRPPLAPYYRDYALLQEVTKAACKRLCGGAITVTHTISLSQVRPTSVTSFYRVGLALGMVAEQDMVAAFSEDNGGDEGAILSLQAAVVDVSLEENVTALEPGSNGVANPEAGGGSVALSDPVRIEVRLEELLQSTSGAKPATAAEKDAAARIAEGQAQWLLTFWTGSQQRKHPEVKFALEGRSCLTVTSSGVGSNEAAAFETEWRKAIVTALKKVEVEDLGPMDSAALWESIPEEDSSGRGRQDLIRVEKELSVKVVFCAPPCKHVLLVGAKAKLSKKCFVLRNLLSHYHWRLSGRDVAFEVMTAKS